MTLRHTAVLLAVIAAGLAVSGCDLLGTDDSGTTTSTAAVYVANQGNFGDGNGSVTVFNPETEQSRPSAISGLNSIVQGIAVRDTNLYVMANSATRIDVFSTTDFSQTGQLTGVSGPRYMAFSGTSTAYVTDQAFGGPSAVRVLDLSGRQPAITSSIEVSGLPEAIATTGDRVYAALGAFGDTTLVATLDATSNSLTDEVDVGCRTRYLVADPDADVFVFCSDAAEAVVLNGNTAQVQTRLSLPDTAATTFGVGQTASLSPETREIYVATNTDILRIDTESNTVATTIDVDNAGSIGAVAYDGLRQELYVARVRGFTERGLVTRHSRDGSRIGSFQAGVAPTFIDFRRTNE